MTPALEPTARPASASVDGELARLVDEITRKLEAGEHVDVDECARSHPNLLEPLQKLMPALEALVLAGAAEHAPDADDRVTDGHRKLGDFRLLRTLGRGGMGVVYEAEQLSMGRRVALKVLPFAALAHGKALERFRNEVRAAAVLDHPHIVSVYSVGEERGVHFYAMQLIRGQTLADLIDQLRNQGQSASPGAGNNNPTVDSGSAGATQPIAHAQVSTARDSQHTAESFRTAARLGIQAAEALQHAHDVGVLHRDIKPSNLMLDGDGQLYITDFGLARIEADAGMTMTGDIIGTLRYMAPEQALAKRVVVDHRADVYSLGATLYELLTLQPAFGETDRSELLKQIAFEEPKPLRKIDRKIPADLETIVLKAMAKSPDERYQTARRLADDLTAFLENQPIKAKRPTWRDQALKYSRRHPAGVRATLIALLTTSIFFAGILGWVARDRAARRTIAEAVASTALDQASQMAEQSKWIDALAEVRRAEDVLVSSATVGSSRTRTRGMREDIEMVLRLDEIRSSPMPGDGEDDRHADRRYAQAFREYGIDVEALPTPLAGERIRESKVSTELVNAIDHWGRWIRYDFPDDDRFKKLFQVASAADDDLWRNRWRNAISKNGDDRKAAATKLAALSTAEDLEQNTSRLAWLLRSSGDLDKAIEVLRTAQRHHPDSFWINFDLGLCFLKVQPIQPDGAIHYLSIALALRPQSWVTRHFLGTALSHSGRTDEAIVFLREALQLRPRDPHVLANLGFALFANNRLDEAHTVCKDAIQLEPALPNAHLVLGHTLLAMGLLDDAISSYTVAIRLDPNLIEAREGLGRALKSKGL